MAARVLDGKALAHSLQEKVSQQVQTLSSHGIVPCLAVVLVGENAASKVYVHRKEVSCEAVGIKSKKILFPETVSQSELLHAIDALNSDASVHGILVQLPLPSHLDERAVMQALSPAKDVDGFHFLNQGKAFANAAELLPNTPRGILALIRASGVPLRGKHAVVVGRSLIVGKPVSVLLLAQDATVTICHSKTTDLASYTRQADFLVVAAGRPHLVTADMVKLGAVVIDVGINRPADGPLCGDVDFESVKEKAGFISPVPGGVGPMTVACLLENTVLACERQSATAPHSHASRRVTIGVLGSTRGTDLQALIDAIAAKTLNAKIGLVVANKPQAYILERAKNHGIASEFIDPKSFPDREAYDERIAHRMNAEGVELVLCIGYNKIITKPLIGAYRNRILNVHPSLLPAFGGKFDADVHQDVLDAGVKVSGATVHIVTEEVDQGPIVLQRAIPIENGETKESLKSKVQSLEGEMLVDAIRRFASGTLLR